MMPEGGPVFPVRPFFACLISYIYHVETGIPGKQDY